MLTFRKTALATTLALALLASPSLAQAHGWKRYAPARVYYPYPSYHHCHGVPAPLIGLGIAGAVLGTVAIVDSIIRPPVVVYAPPPPPPYNPYEDGYRRGYDQGRHDTAYPSPPPRYEY